MSSASAVLTEVTIELIHCCVDAAIGSVLMIVRKGLINASRTKDLDWPVPNLSYSITSASPIFSLSTFKSSAAALLRPLSPKDDPRVWRMSKRRRNLCQTLRGKTYLHFSNERPTTF